MGVELATPRTRRFNRKSVRTYFYSLLDYLGLPRIPLYAREEPTSSEDDAWGIFNLDKNKEPYIVLWKDGWTSSIIKHEVIHYLQFLLYGEKFLYVVSDPDPYELEAEALENLSRVRLKKYVNSRLIIRDLQKGHSDDGSTPYCPCSCQRSYLASSV